MKPIYVKLYSTTTCPYCTMEKNWLETNKVKYQQVMVDLDQKEAMQMVMKTGQMGVPVTEIGFDNTNPQYIVGFDQARLATTLGLKG